MNTITIKCPEWLGESEIETIPAEYNKSAGTLTFNDKTETEVEEIVYSVPFRTLTKEFKFGKSKAVEGEELMMLQEQTDLDLSAGKVYKFEAANTRIDRTNERFTPEVLGKFATDINNEGRAFLWSHNRDQVIGKIFAAKLVETTDGNIALNEWAFVMTGTKMPGQDIELSKAIETGIVDFVSVGFSAYLRKANDKAYEYYIDPNNADHMTYTEQTELSAVYLGAQRGARKKTVDFNIKYINMDNNEKVKELELKLTESNTIIGEKDTEINGLKGEIETLKSANENLNGQVEKFIEPYRNDVINLQKKYLPEGAQLSEDQVKGLPFDQVIAMAEGFRKNEKSTETPPTPEKKKGLGFN